ncbi:MAG: benzoate-CoA ligase family protein [Thaumarchaeota archaeon]|nr:benzoate-CoA ligase family protein [Candidatus Calditenuaceae archaeon]
MTKLNLAEELIDKWVDLGRDRAEAVFEVNEGANGFGAVTYQGLQDYTCRIASFLRDLNVGWFNRVAILLSDSVAWIASFLGAVRIGAVPVIISPLNRPETWSFIVRDSRPKVLITDSKIFRSYPWTNSGHFPKATVLVDEPLNGHPSLKEVMEDSASFSEFVEPADTVADDFAFILYTSGSTAVPKGVMHLQHDLPEAADSLFRDALGLCEGDRFYSVSKLYFSFGMTNTLSALRLGASAIVDGERSTPERVLRVLNLLEPTAVFAAATVYARLLDRIDERNSSTIKKIKVLVSGGEHLPEKVQQAWYERFGKSLIDGIGSTEYLHKVTFNGPGCFKSGSLGKPLKSHDVKIVDEDWNELKPGQVGRLAVKCEACTPLYWHRSDLNRKVIRGGWVMLDDLCYIDEEGFLFHVGRANEMIKQAGMWVSPFEIEDVLMGHPAVSEALVVKATDERGLHRVRALVVLKKSVAPSSQLAHELKEFVKSKLEPYKRPEWIEFVEELPLTVTGKRKRIL